MGVDTREVSSMGGGKGVLESSVDSSGDDGDSESGNIGTILEKQCLPHCDPGIRDSHQDHHGLKGTKDLQGLILQSHHTAHPFHNLLRGVTHGGEHKVLDELNVGGGLQQPESAEFGVDHCKGNPIIGSPFHPISMLLGCDGLGICNGGKGPCSCNKGAKGPGGTSGRVRGAMKSRDGAIDPSLAVVWHWGQIWDAVKECCLSAGTHKPTVPTRLFGLPFTVWGTEFKTPTDFFLDDEYYNSSNDSKMDAIHKEMGHEVSEGDSGQITGREDEEYQESEENTPNAPTCYMFLYLDTGLENK
ncbi:hypothetical protein P691DRAFT_790564 [Macrolepiota fuliginosa MF-IS2]|uniref:Uncharacterized protein n=1 Tax=Macrolepiota fuliginosa MF-IS2 TaxID=1400762 RepID=A0A9P5X2T0_9AGAR|nr:hypothetical protein P691DRAFT_790564 [Macrolepiota fuliginosa MF-IS2]